MKKPRILVVDDNDIMRETIKDILDFEGFDVEIAHGGVAAVDLLDQFQYDLVITDILMPHRDGYDIINLVRSKYLQTKVIAISGGGYITSEAYLAMATDAGAHAVLSKPFDVDQFIDTVKNTI